MEPGSRAANSEGLHAQTPSPVAAAAMLRGIDAAQAAVQRSIPSWGRATATNLLTYGPLFAAAFLLFDVHGVHRVYVYALGGGILAAALCVQRVLDRPFKGRGLASRPKRWPRGGARRLSATDPTSLYLTVLVGIVTGSWVVSVVAIGGLLATEGILARAQRRGQFVLRGGRRSLTTHDSFYREFLDNDVLALTAALALLQTAKLSAISATIGMTSGDVDAALSTLDGLGYLDWSSRPDGGRGSHVSLNYFGRKAFRHQLALLEATASPGPARRPPR